ncbi:saccharopine dehydrogenase [Stachybotrys elegans]|uniref:Saccharopine dehydrogenase n=1 Tax=Stachybotrys elegans TaxID=80388 RepID=A0A8K0WL28_9HYPO|nr:saccharopine dehydrogenase [Stachybotrys elegans]
MGKNILVLGSGMVAKPCVDFLCRNVNNNLTLACRTLSAAEKLVAGRPRLTAIALDVQSPDLDRVVAEHDIVISLVPFIHHPVVIRSAIKGKTNVVTTSYVSPAMLDLDASAKEAGITVLNEVGVDPGVDHLYAVKVITDVHEKGGKVKEFYSYCGGLAAPEAADNPLRFKFSWSPRGALLSKYNSATFLQDGHVVEIPREKLMAKAQPYHVLDGYSFVAYPNRNSVPFREAYQIPEAHTVIRGSLRYEGNPALVKALIELGWLDSSPQPWLNDGMTWAQIQQRATGADTSAEEDLIAQIDKVCTFSSTEERSNVISGLRWMGLFSSDIPKLQGNLLDTLSARLARLCSFLPGERDLVMLQHKFVVEWKDGSTNTITATLELFGEPDGYSAMSKSVGITCGIATQLLLDGLPAFNKPGILAPYSKDICDPIRASLEKEGIRLVEKMV